MLLFYQPRYLLNVHQVHAYTGMYPVCYVWGMSERVYIHHQTKSIQTKPTLDSSLRLNLQRKKKKKKKKFRISEGH